MLPFENHSNYNCKITLDDGQEYLIYANWLHNNKLDQWTDWNCSGGHTRFHIDKNFDIWSGECKNDHLGNVLTEWSPKFDVKCHQPTCTGCTDDLITEKHAHART